LLLAILAIEVLVSFFSAEFRTLLKILLAAEQVGITVLLVAV